MQVFKLCMKIIRKNKAAMLVYVLVFLGIAILISRITAQHPVTSAFSTAKANVAFFTEENTPLVTGIKQELSKSSNFVKIEDNTEALQDALYFRQVTYIVRIPKGFTDKIMNGEKATLERTTVPDSVYGTYIDMKINRYLNMASLYVNSVPGISQEKLVSDLKDDMGKSALVTMTSAKKANDSEKPFTAYYFNFLAYVLPAVLIFGISIVMQIMNEKDRRSRTFCSPISPKSYNAQLIFSIGFLAVACWAVLILPCAVLDPSHFFQQSTWYLVLNSFVFLLASLGLGFLISIFVQGMSAVSALANICTLGPCFIAGVFVPQAFLGSTVLKVASFTPTYWFVKVNDTLASTTHFSYDVLSPVYGDILIELAFAAAFFAVGLAGSKRKRLET